MLSRLLRSLLLVLAWTLLGGAAVSFLGGSRCVYVSRHCDDDDDPCDDDDDACDDDDDDGVICDDGAVPAAGGGEGAPSLLGAPPELFRIDAFALLVEEESPPARRVAGVRGLSLFAFEGADVWDEADLRLYTSLVILENEELLGIAGRALRLSFEGVEHGPDRIGVGWREVPPGGGAGIELRFAFDRLGNLRAVESRFPDGE